MKGRKRHFSYLAVMAERKCGSRISQLWQLKQSISGEELQTCGGQCRAEVRMRQRLNGEVDFTSLEVLVEQMRKRNLSSPGRTESRISRLCQSRQSGNVEAKLQSFRSPSRVEVRKLNFISLAVKAGRKCRSGDSHLRKNWQGRNAERKSCHIMGSQGRAEMRKRNFTLLVAKTVWKCTFRSLAVTTEQKCESGASDH